MRRQGEWERQWEKKGRGERKKRKKNPLRTEGAEPTGTPATKVIREVQSFPYFPDVHPHSEEVVSSPKVSDIFRLDNYYLFIYLFSKFWILFRRQKNQTNSIDSRFLLFFCFFLKSKTNCEFHGFDKQTVIKTNFRFKKQIHPANSIESQRVRIVLFVTSVFGYLVGENVDVSSPEHTTTAVHQRLWDCRPVR